MEEEMAATSPSTPFPAPIFVRPEVVNATAQPAGVVSVAAEGSPATAPEPYAPPSPPFLNAKQMAMARQNRADLEAVGKRIIMAMNRQAPCKIKFGELGVVLHAIRSALR
jgi:hypothetical protein